MNKYIYLALLSTLSVWTSCSEESPSQPMERRRPASVNFDIQLPEEVATRAIHENHIYNITVLVFDQGGILFSKDTASISTVPLTGASLPVIDVIIEDNCRIYAVANIGHNTQTNANFFHNFFQGIVEESDMLRIIRASNIYTDIPVTVTANSALTMVGKTQITDIASVSGPITIPLQRIMAKIAGTINVKTAATNAGVTLVGARIGSVADATYLFPKGTDIPLNSEEYSISDWFAPADATRSKITLPANLYVFENHKGDGMNKTNISKDGGYLAPANATYLEILLDKGGARYYYRIYLGSNTTTNYDIDRNTIYTVTVNINSVNNIESDIRVTRLTEEVFWYNTSGLLLHYDGINNNGRAPRVTNASGGDYILDPPRPEAKGSAYDNTKFYYDYTNVPAGTYGGTNSGSLLGTAYSGGSYIPIVTTSPATDGMRNRWKNIAPATIGRYNMPIYPSNRALTTIPNCWGPDCFTSTGANYFASMEYDETNAPELFPELFTIECVFLSSPLNISSTGNDLFGIFLAPGIPYVIADVEIFQGGFGLIAGTTHNNMNFGTNDMINKKRRLVLQFDGQKMIAWYDNKMVFTEPKRVSGPLPWTKGPMGSPGPNHPNTALRADFATQLNLGTWSRHQTADIFRGNIYAFRFYNRVLSKEELDHNFSLDVKRFGMSK